MLPDELTLEPLTELDARTSAPALSVVVCSFNGERTLGACLDALDRQRGRQAVEVIVVDDGSGDGTRAIASRPGVRLVALDTNGGLSAARNAGLAVATAPLVAFTDDDCVPEVGWAANTIAAFDADARTLAVGGEVDALHHDSLVRRYLAANNPLQPLEIEFARGSGLANRLRIYVRQQAVQRAERRDAYSLVGASMAFRRDTLLDIGGFAPDILFGGDDEYVCTRIRDQHGIGSLVVDSRVRVAHDFDPRLRDTLRRSFAYGVGNGRQWRWHGGLPSVGPTPLAAGVVAAALLPVGLGASLGGFVAVPALVYRRWLIDAVRRRSGEAIVWPVLQFSQEVTANAGFVAGWWRYRGVRS